MCPVWILEFPIPDILTYSRLGKACQHLEWFTSTILKLISLAKILFSCIAPHYITNSNEGRIKDWYMAFPHTTSQHSNDGRIKDWYMALSVSPFRNDLVLYRSPIFLLTEFLAWVRWPFQGSLGSKYTPRYLNELTSSNTSLQILTLNSSVFSEILMLLPESITLVFFLHWEWVCF